MTRSLVGIWSASCCAKRLAVIALNSCVFAVILGIGLPVTALGNTLPPLIIPGTNVGPIPDGIGPGCGPAGPPLDVSFAVPNLEGREISNIELELTFVAPGHTWGGDVTARIIDPSGTRNHVLFGRVGATTAAGCGDNSNLLGPYLFSDAASPPFGGFWQAATAATADQAVAPGSYFTTASGGEGATNPMPPTSLAAVFGGLQGAEASGNWILRLTDGGVGDTGSIESANLILHLSATETRLFSDRFEFSQVANNGQNLGPIPDGGGAGCGTPGAPRDVLFDIPPFPGYVVKNVEISMSFGDPIHTWAGDVTASLIDPGGTRSHVIFGRVGVTTAAGCGDNSNLRGPYLFSDAASPPFGGFWQAAAAATTNQAIAPGSYFTTGSGGASATNPMPPTTLQATFGGMSSAEAAGTWVLRLTDSGFGDTGAISAARLVILVEPE